MSKAIEEIRRKLEEMIKQNDQTFLATVKEVDDEEFTCLVETDPEIQFSDVRLRSIINPEKTGFCFIPAVESFVLVSRISNSNELYISLFSEIEKIIYTGVDMSIVLDPDKTEIKKGENEEVSVLIDATQIVATVKDRTVKMDENEIVFNGNDKGSYLTDINSLVSKINNLEDELNSLKQVFTTWIPAPMDGGAVLKGAVTSWATKVIQPKTSVNDLKDELIKH